jgi:hypothetical protein
MERPEGMETPSPPVDSAPDDLYGLDHETKEGTLDPEAEEKPTEASPDLATDPEKTSSKAPSSGLARKLAKAKPKSKAKAKDPGGSSSRKTTAPKVAPTKGRAMAGKKKDGANGETDKVGISITPEAAKAIRRMRAKLELDSGDRTSNSDAILEAVKVALGA